MPAPDLEQLLFNWWGGNVQLAMDLRAGLASNIVVGDNPPYQLSDFLAIYPKFGTGAQEINSLQLNDGGIGYSLNDILTLIQSDASMGTVKATAVDINGAISSFLLRSGGTGYRIEDGVISVGGTGSGAKFNILGITPLITIIPSAVLQMYINLASASLSQARWLEQWPMAMSLYVAHFATLYLRSEGNPGNTPGQIALSGLDRGIMIQKSAGDVSATMKPMFEGMEDWGAWTLTTYGSQLVTMARIVGMGPMYIY